MKQLLLILCLFATIGLQAQPYPRGAYGNLQPVTHTAMGTLNAAGTVKLAGKDTLVNGDTGYVWVGLGVNYDMSFDLYTVTISGTVASTANILQGSNTGRGLTADWHTITGVTTYCADCIGASSTTVPGASKHYVWQVPHSAASFDFYRIRTIQTGTATAIYTGTVTTTY